MNGLGEIFGLVLLHDELRRVGSLKFAFMLWFDI